MHATVVLLIAMGGLGCQNPPSTAPPAPPQIQAPAALPTIPATTPGSEAGPASSLSDVGPAQPLGDINAADTAAPPPYPVYSGGPFSAFDVPEDDSFRACVRNTFCSFFTGKDPSIPSARQIQAAYEAGLYNN